MKKLSLSGVLAIIFLSKNIFASQTQTNPIRFNPQNGSIEEQCAMEDRMAAHTIIALNRMINEDCKNADEQTHVIIQALLVHKITHLRVEALHKAHKIYQQEQLENKKNSNLSI